MNISLRRFSLHLMLHSSCRKSLSDTVISTSAYCHPGGWCSHNSCGSLFLVDGKGDDSWRAGDCDVTHVKGRSSRKVTVNQRGSRTPLRWWMLPQSAISMILPEWRFQKPLGLRAYPSFLLSPVIGQSQLEDAENLWLLCSKVRFDTVIPLRKFVP